MALAGEFVCLNLSVYLLLSWYGCQGDSLVCVFLFVCLGILVGLFTRQVSQTQIAGHCLNAQTKPQRISANQVIARASVWWFQAAASMAKPSKNGEIVTILAALIPNRHANRCEKNNLGPWCLVTNYIFGCQLPLFECVLASWLGEAMRLKNVHRRGWGVLSLDPLTKCLQWFFAQPTASRAHQGTWTVGGPLN